MKRREGYIVLEISISMLITSIVLIILYSLLFTSMNMYKRIYSSIEIQQQGLEIQKHMEKELSGDIEITNVKTENSQILTGKEFELTKVKSIYYKSKTNLECNECDELFLNKKTKKLFIKRMGYKSGYEVGDYIDDIYISKEKDGRIVNIKLELSKNKQKHCIEFSIYNDDIGELV